MPLAVTRTSTVPPNGWRYYIEATQRWVCSDSLPGLIGAVIRHLQTNHLPIPSDIDIVVEDQVCQNIPAASRTHSCYQVPGPDMPPVEIKRALTWADLANFLSVLAGWAANGGKLDSQDTATKRAEICSTCPYNIQVAGCAGCHSIANQLTQLIGANSTGLESSLRGCAVCGCDNRAQVWFPLSVLGKGITEDMEFPDWCWKKPREQHGKATEAN